MSPTVNSIFLCRHVLEYDVASLIMLAEYRRVTKRTAKMALP